MTDAPRPPPAHGTLEALVDILDAAAYRVALEVACRRAPRDERHAAAQHYLGWRLHAHEYDPALRRAIWGTEHDGRIVS